MLATSPLGWPIVDVPPVTNANSTDWFSYHCWIRTKITFLNCPYDMISMLLRQPMNCSESEYDHPIHTSKTCVLLKNLNHESKRTSEPSSETLDAHQLTALWSLAFPWPFRQSPVDVLKKLFTLRIFDYWRSFLPVNLGSLQMRCYFALAQWMCLILSFELLELLSSDAHPKSVLTWVFSNLNPLKFWNAHTPWNDSRRMLIARGSRSTSVYAVEYMSISHLACSASAFIPSKSLQPNMSTQDHV